MKTHGKNGFALPWSMLIGSTLLILSTLLVSHGQYFLREEDARRHRKNASQIVLNHARPLINDFIEQLNDPERASALVSSSKGLENQRSIFAGVDGDFAIPLYSNVGNDTPEVLFNSPVSNSSLKAELIRLSPTTSTTDVQLAWVFQDAGLESAINNHPDFWPLQDFRWAPMDSLQSPASYLESATDGQWLQGPWIPLPEDLPFIPEASPSLVPVLERLDLVFGIFASGPARNREKEIRIRFYLEGQVWNPYNRPMRFHSGSGSRAAFRVIFHSLPEVKIRNLTKGVSSNWIRLDESRNTSTGAIGIHGWISLPSTMGRGQRFAFSEPDPKWQPQGLARTLHPAFPVGEGDAISLEFRDAGTGLHTSCLSLSGDDPLKEARQGFGWHRIVGFPIESLTIEYPRADTWPKPFYLSGGSLSFRKTNATFKICTGILPEALEGETDPRRLSWEHLQGRRNASGQWRWDKDLISAEFGLIESDPQPLSNDALPLFSWPGNQPESLVETSDLPQWRDGFRLGSTGASELNKILQHEWAWNHPAGQNLVSLQTRTGELKKFRKILPVNTLSPDVWENAVYHSSIQAQGLNLTYSAYPWYNMKQPTDLVTQSMLDLKNSTTNLTSRIRASPSHSVGNFFDRGILKDSMTNSVLNLPLQNLLPLRGWLRNETMLKNSSSSWILHMAVLVQTSFSSTWRTARVWLLETEADHMEVIQFEWTEPRKHLANFTR